MGISKVKKYLDGDLFFEGEGERIIRVMKQQLYIILSKCQLEDVLVGVLSIKLKLGWELMMLQIECKSLIGEGLSKLLLKWGLI